MVLEELSSKEPKAKSGKFEDFVDLRAEKDVLADGAVIVVGRSAVIVILKG